LGGVALIGALDVVVLSGGVAHAQTPIDDMKADRDDKKSSKEAEKERIQAANEERRNVPARVVVLPNGGIDWTNVMLRDMVASRIRRPNATFVQAMDLFQVGRARYDDDDRVLDIGRQRGSPDQWEADDLYTQAERLLKMPWDTFEDSFYWREPAEELLLAMEEQLWFVDRKELREPLFMVYSALGYASDNADYKVPPFQERVDDSNVNYFWYEAARLALDDQGLLELIPATEDGEMVHGALTSLMDRIEGGEFSPMILDFAVEGQRFDAAEFGSTYKIWINGFEIDPVNIDPERGQMKIPPGRADIFLEHSAGGYSMSHSRSVLDPGISEYVRVVGDARKRMAFDFRLDLQKHPTECSPPVEGEIIAFLSIYSKLHPGEEVYIVLPEDGSLKSEAILSWRWEQDQNRLILAKPEGPDYPVLFTMQLGVGGIWDNFGLEFGEAPAATTGTDLPGLTDYASADLKPRGVPINYEFRIHRNHFMLQLGAQWSIATGPNLDGTDELAGLTACEEGYCDLYQTDAKDNGSHYTNADGDIVLRDLAAQRLLHFGMGYMFGVDAGMGVGPYVLMRSGKYNVPNGWDLTAHVGWTFLPPFTEQSSTGRTKALLTLDAFGGGMIPVGNSLFVLGEKEDITRVKNFDGSGKMRGHFGFVASGGLSF
jgi:hypothetical protein